MPTGTDEKEKRPPASVATAVSEPVATFSRATLTAGRAPPAASVTDPRISAVSRRPPPPASVTDPRISAGSASPADAQTTDPASTTTHFHVTIGHPGERNEEDQRTRNPQSTTLARRSRS